MKKYFKYISIATVITLVISSCSDSYLDVNTDPNNPTSVDPELVLPVALNFTARGHYASGGNLGIARNANTFGNMMMCNWSQADGFSWYYDEFNYLMSSNFYGSIFNYPYLNTLKQLTVLSDLGENYDNYEAISKIMIAYTFQGIVDGYGDVPYFDALQRGGNPTPAYDDDEVIYEDLLVKLDEAIAQIKQASPEAIVPSTESDIMFGGNMTSWIQFANTIKLRILVRQSGVKDISSGIQSIVNEGSGFITSDVSINPGYVNEEGKQNPFYASFGLTVSGETQNNGQATCASEYVIDYLSTTNDPRISRIYEEPSSGHLGVVQGLLDYPVDDSLEPQFVSNLGPGILYDASQDALVMTVAESLFLQAEAALSFGQLGDPKTLYESAIEASFATLGASNPANYYNQAIQNVGWDASPNKVEAIITQKWVALNGTNGYESWIEYNRTGFPSGLPIPLFNSHSDRPTRLSYPASEVTGNTQNIPDQPDEFSSKPFWGN